MVLSRTTISTPAARGLRPRKKMSVQARFRARFVPVEDEPRPLLVSCASPRYEHRRRDERVDDESHWTEDPAAATAACRAGGTSDCSGLASWRSRRFPPCQPPAPTIRAASRRVSLGGQDSEPDALAAYVTLPLRRSRAWPPLRLLCSGRQTMSISVCDPMASVARPSPGWQGTAARTHLLEMRR